MENLSFSVIRFTRYENNFCVVFFSEILVGFKQVNFLKYFSLYKFNDPLIFPYAKKKLCRIKK